MSFKKEVKNESKIVVLKRGKRSQQKKIHLEGAIQIEIYIS